MQKIKLGKILDVKRGASLSGEYYAEEGKLIRLTLGNFDYPSRGFKKNTAKSDIYFNGPIKPEFILKKGDIITPLTEQVKGLLGETARIPEDGLYIQSGDIGLIIPKEELLDKNFAYYLISSPLVKRQLSAGSQKTKIRHTSPDAIKDCTVWLPELREQKKIAEILDDIENKIRLNDHHLEVMEKIISMYYDYWFVQFDFPNKNEEPYKCSNGEMIYSEVLKKRIPAGWEVKKLKDISHIDNQSITPKAEILYNHYSIPAFDSSQTPLKEFGEEIDSGKYIVPSDAILVSKLNPKFKRVWFVGNVEENSITSTEFMPFVCDGTDLGFLYGVLNSREFYSYMVQSASSSTGSRKRMDPDLCLDFHFVQPDAETIHKYTKLVEPLLYKISELRKENANLFNVKAFIFPMLMNGEIVL